MHNLKTVISFEIIRTLKKKSFWIMALAFPLMMAAIFSIIFLSNNTTEEAAKNIEKQQFSIGITDESHTITSEVRKATGAQDIASRSAGIAAIEAGTIDAYFYYPANYSTKPVEVYGQDVGLFDNGRYAGVAQNLLEMSVGTSVDANISAVLKNSVMFNAVTYRDGKPYDRTKEMIAPAVFLVLFYLLIALFGNQMLASTTEEKENRVIEMILTTIEANTLIIGKIISLVVLGFVQVLTIIIPILVAYLFFREQLSIPAIDLTSIPIDIGRMLIGGTIFVASFMLFTGLLVAIGAAAPTAKEAGGFIGVVMILIFGPLYAAPLFVSVPGSPLVQFLSYFPFTAPIPLLLRNAIGNLSLIEALIAIAILIVTAVLVVRAAVRIFRYGVLEYNRRLTFKEIFVRR